MEQKVYLEILKNRINELLIKWTEVGINEYEKITLEKLEKKYREMTK